MATAAGEAAAGGGGGGVPVAAVEDPAAASAAAAAAAAAASPEFEAAAGPARASCASAGVPQWTALFDGDPSALDVALFDQVVEHFFTPGPLMTAAQQSMAALQLHPQAWLCVDSVLSTSSSSLAKELSLQLLDPVVRYSWGALPRAQCDGVRGFVVAQIIAIASDPSVAARNTSLLNRLNITLAQIAKQEWPRNWETFVGDLVGSSQTSESLCQNNMHLLRLMSEEIFESEDSMLTAKQSELKQQFNKEFAMIFNLCQDVLDSSQNSELLRATLQALLKFQSWIPLEYVFETRLIDSLTTRFLPHPPTRNAALACLTEIMALQVDPSMDTHFVRLFTQAMDLLVSMVPPESDLATAHMHSATEEQDFIVKLTLFLTTSFRTHGKLLEGPATQAHLTNGHVYICQVSYVEEVEVFKICLEYWQWLASSLYTEGASMAGVFGGGGAAGAALAAGGFGGLLGAKQAQARIAAAPGGGGLMTESVASGVTVAQQRRALYAGVLSRARVALIQRMPRPEEVVVTENEEGEIIKQHMKDTDAITLYKSMRETLVYLTHLDPDDTQNIMLARLADQVSGAQWAWDKLNTLCWAIGAISGAQSEAYEKRFLVTVIKDLLGMCEHKRGKNNKAVIASNIMYIVGQYPRFLRAHWKFLKTVVMKLFEFMHELHPGVQDMAVDTFLKIAQKCRRKFVLLQPAETLPFVEEILMELTEHVKDLVPQQIHIFYEAVGFMVQSEPDAGRKEALLAALLQEPSARWRQALDAAAVNPVSLQQQDTMLALSNVLKTHLAVCRAVGDGYASQMAAIFGEMLQVYQTYSGMVSACVAQQGERATNELSVRTMRLVKKDCLRLIEAFVERSENPQWVAETLIPPLLEAVLGDYRNNVPNARDAEVLSAISAIVAKLGDHVTKDVPRIFDHVFECTLEMITKNFQDFPDARVQFFALLRSINAHCFGAFFQLSPEHFKLVIDAVVWAFKHMERTVSETGLTIMLELLHNVARAGPEITNAFFAQYALAVVQDVFAVMTDTYHKSGFGQQAAILLVVFGTIQAGAVTAPLWTAESLAALDANRAAVAAQQLAGLQAAAEQQRQEAAANPADVALATAAQTAATAAATAAATPVTPLDPATMTNQMFVHEYVGWLLGSGFAHLTRNQVTVFVQGLADLAQDLPAFKNHVRDFLIQTKEFASSNNAELYLEEKQAQLAVAREQREMLVPGLVPQSFGTHELVDDGDDIAAEESAAVG